ncbi:unnamed protein product, partial [Clonostachys solani]
LLGLSVVANALVPATSLTAAVQTGAPEPPSTAEIYANLGSTYDKTERPFIHGNLPFVEVSPSNSGSALAERSELDNPDPETSSGKKTYDLGHELCRFRVDDAEDARRVWSETGAGTILDKWVNEMDANNETQWLRQFQEVYLGDPDYLRCDNLGGYTCKIDHQMCNKMAKDGLAGHYWILRAVTSMNSLLSHLKDSIEINKEYFDMPKLVESFKPGDNKYSVRRALESIALAFRISNSAKAPIETFSQAAQDAIGVVESLNPVNKLDLATEVLAGVTTSQSFVSEIENRGESRKLDELLKDLGQRYSGTMERHLQRLMWTALGNQDRANLPQNLLTGDGGYKTDIGKLFGDGKWLLEDASFSLQPFMDQTMLLATQKFLIDVLRSSEATMFVDTQNRRDWCEGEIAEDGYITHQIMDMGLGKDACVGLQKKKWSFISVDQEKLLADRFHMNTNAVFRHLWDCAKDSRYTVPDVMEAIPVGEMKSDGTLPHCYFAMQVFMGNRYDWVANRKDVHQYLVNNWTSNALITREQMFSNNTWNPWSVFGLGVDLPAWIHGRG